MASRSKKPQPKMTPAQALKTAKRLALEGRIEIADTTLTEQLLPWIDRIISAMGYKWAMTTDESRISDCLGRGYATPEHPHGERQSHEQIEQECQLLSHKLGVPVARNDTFVAVAKRMKQRESQ